METFTWWLLHWNWDQHIYCWIQRTIRESSRFLRNLTAVKSAYRNIQSSTRRACVCTACVIWTWAIISWKKSTKTPTGSLLSLSIVFSCLPVDLGFVSHPPSTHRDLAVVSLRLCPPVFSLSVLSKSHWGLLFSTFLMSVNNHMQLSIVLRDSHSKHSEPFLF